MGERGQNIENSRTLGQIDLSRFSCKLLGMLPVGWLRGRDFNPRPLGGSPMRPLHVCGEEPSWEGLSSNQGRASQGQGQQRRENKDCKVGPS